MRTFPCLALAVLLLAQATERAAEPLSVSVLTAQLGSPRFAERQAAARALVELGEAAVEELCRGASSADPEVRRQCQELLRGLELRSISAKMLAAERVRLSYKDTPLTAAVVDFERKTGFTLGIAHADQLKDRTITLATEDVSSWEAFDRFCRAAGLVEYPLWDKCLASEEERQSLHGAGGGDDLMRWLGRVQKELFARHPPGDIRHKRHVMVVPADLPAMPTSYAGALRVRVLPLSPTPGWGRTSECREARFALDVTPAPHLAWLGVVDVRLREVVDDQGQKLEQLPIEKILPTARESEEDVEKPVSSLEQRKVDVCLRLGRKPTQMLRSVRGTIVCRLLKAPEPLLTLDQILEAQGRTVRDLDGRSIEVVEVTPDRDGKIEIMVRVRMPPEDRTRRGMQLWIRRYFQRELFDESVKDLELHDGKGTPLRCLDRSNIDDGLDVTGTYQAEARLRFQAGPEQGEAAKLIRMGRRPVLVEAPFSLVNVPLP